MGFLACALLILAPTIFAVRYLSRRSVWRKIDALPPLTDPPVPPPNLGHVRGQHYVERWSEVSELRAAERNGEAEKLLLEICAACEEESRFRRWNTTPEAFRQLAVMYRRQKRFGEEVAILERYRAAQLAAGQPASGFDERLAKARHLLTTASRER